MSARFVGSTDGNQISILKTLPVASGVTVNDGDFVYYASGRITSATITGSVRLVGVAQGTAVTGNAGGTNTMLVNVDPNALYLVPTSGGSPAAADVGKYFGLTGATGAQTVLHSTPLTSSGVLLLTELGTTVAGPAASGIYKIVNHYTLPYVANV